MSIPLHLVNGFLGSGKTTFLLHYLHIFGAARKIGVIQNEFSPASVDGKLIDQQGGAYELLEINNGSVFCVCLLGSFIDSLSAFIADYSPDEIIMEASGMSDPVSIGQIFQSPKLKNKVFLGHTWTLVDAHNFHRVKAIRSRLEHQIRIADTVLINKCDLATPVIESVTDAVRLINPFAIIEKTSFAAAQFSMQKKAVIFFPPGENTESCRPDLQSVVIKTNRIITPEKFNEFIQFVKTDFIRCKGFVCTGNAEKVLVQGIYEDYSITRVGWFPGPTELVGIGILHDSLNYTDIFEKFCVV
jgi:G3E family GTPase